MSSTNVASMSLQDLLNLRSNIDSQIFKHTGEATVVSVEPPAARSSRAGQPSCYGSFSSLIQKTHSEDVAAYKAAHPELKSGHLNWVGEYMKQHAEEYEAFKAKWSEEHPKQPKEPKEKKVRAKKEKEPKSDGEEKPKKVLSPEHLAKMKAGREAKKAKKDAAKSSESQPAVESAPESPKADAAAPDATAPDAEEKPRTVDEVPFKHGGVTYIRLGYAEADGSHTWASADLWLSKKGARGAYVGELQESGEINEDAEEPALE